MKSIKTENGKSVYDVLVRSKSTGNFVRTQCKSYSKYGNLMRFLSKHEDKIQVLIVDPAPGVFLDWDTFVSVIK